MEDTIAVSLLHASVNIVARVAKLGNLFSQQLHALSRVAENDALVDLQLGEERVETVHLLPFLDESVVLRDTL